MIASATASTRGSSVSIIDDDSTYCTSTTTANAGDATSDSIYRTGNVYLIYQVSPAPVFNDDFFEWLWLKREADRKEAVYLNRLFIEHFNRLQISLIFNTYSVLFYRRMMFPKSGFLARAGRRRRN